MSAICLDCGADTTPCTGKRGCRHAGKWEYYAVRDQVWAAAGMPKREPMPYGESAGDFLCIGCLEKRLGRTLRRRDFTDAIINRHDDPWHTPRLRARLLGVGLTAEEMIAALNERIRKLGKDVVRKEISDFMEQDSKASQLHKVAKRHGYRLLKSRTRPQNTLNDRGLYQLVDDRNTVVTGANFDATLDHVAACLDRVNEQGWLT